MKQLLLLVTALVLSSNPSKAQSYWNPVSSGTQKQLLSISFGSSKVGYISGEDSTLLRTLDGGMTWTPLASSGMGFGLANRDIIHVNFVSAGTGYAITSDHDNPVYKGTLYKTSDSGRTWTTVNAGNIAMARTFFFDADNGFGIGSAFFAGYTLVKQSAGAWGPTQQFSFDPSKFLFGIDFYNSSTGIVGGHRGYVYRTFNGGTTWDTVKTAVDSTINDLKFLNAHTILGASDNDGCAMIISYDTGRTWQLETNTLTFSYPDIKGLVRSPHDSFIAVGHSQFATSGIILWDRQGIIYNYISTQRLNAVAMQSDSIAYTVGDSGLILTNRQAAAGITPAKTSLSLLQIYPNPASDYCNTSAQGLHRINLYDMTGRLVVAQQGLAMQHTISLGALGRGVYLVQVIGEDGMQVCRRLVVQSD